jgi:uncharacterized protein YbjT (DUF2867 family)
MKIVVIGGTGLVGSKLVAELSRRGHEAVAASPASGVDTMTGAGVTEVLTGAAVVVDVSNSPVLDGAAALEFFQTSTATLLAADRAAGVGLHVALSVVGTDRLLESGYFRAKTAQENLIEASGIPYTIVHATQFFEFVPSIAKEATDGSTVRLAPVHIQPMAADDVAMAVAHAAVSRPADGIVEVAGPEVFRLDELVAQVLTERGDPREVVPDPRARYFGVELQDTTLLPGAGATIYDTRLETWLKAQGPTT